jgi:uncharacterized OB-fold protein
MSTTVPVAEGLFTWPSEDPQLIGASCARCGITTFPSQSSCPKCTGQEMADALLPREGSLWTFTVQTFRPKTPPYAADDDEQTFVPYGVGYVELGDVIRVESRLTENRVENLSIGMPMRLEIVPFATDEQGREVVTFAFAPLGD